MAKEKRPENWRPPINVVSDGTVSEARINLSNRSLSIIVFCPSRTCTKPIQTSFTWNQSSMKSIAYQPEHQKSIS